MPRIVGGGGGIPPERISSPDSTESVKETKTSERTDQQESTSPASSEHKLSADTRAVAEHKMMGNLQQMQLNSMLNKMQTKSGTNSPSSNTNGSILAGDFNYVEPESESFQKADPISYQSPNTGTSKAWEFENGYPVKWRGPDFDASKNEIAIESLKIAHEGFSPTGSSTPQGVEYPNLTIYVPEQNDTLQSIASKFGITEEALAKANNLNPRDPLPAGIQLRIVREK
jgi:phage tail-like protein